MSRRRTEWELWKMLLIVVVVGVILLPLLGGCGSSPTAPPSCPKGRTDCTPYILPHDTLAHP